MKTLAQLCDELDHAAAAFTEAVGAESQARSRRCTALNKLNERQAAISRAVADMKKVAPAESDWGIERTRNR